jgi:hypothetical protein
MMREPDEQAQRVIGHPPEGRPRPHRVEQQRQSLRRHDDEGRQRDRDDIGERAIKPRLVKMEQRDRRQGDLDYDAGDQQAGDAAPEAEGKWLLAPRDEALHRPAFVERDDRGYRREAELETRPDQRLGPPQ